MTQQRTTIFFFLFPQSLNQLRDNKPLIISSLVLLSFGHATWKEQKPRSPASIGSTAEALKVEGKPKTRIYTQFVSHSLSRFSDPLYVLQQKVIYANKTTQLQLKQIRICLVYSIIPSTIRFFLQSHYVMKISFCIRTI